MGGICGGDSLDDKKPNIQSNKSASISQGGGESSYKIECGKNKLEVRGKLIFSPPILNGKRVILLHSNAKKKCTKYNILELDGYKLNDAIEVKCDDDFNIYNTVYALNENDNKIYFIENNSKLSVLDMDTNTITSLNKTITTTNNNKANIVYNPTTKKLYILGAENEEKGGDDTFEYVPYSTAVKKTQGDDNYSPKFSEFGLRSKALCAKFEGEDYIFTLGGQTHYPESDKYLPNDLFGRYIVSKGPKDGYTDNKDEQKSQRWDVGYLAQATQRCGVVNYKNKYLITFGGDIMKERKVNARSDMVYLTPLKDDKKYGLEAKEWYELPSLSRKGHYHALYDGGDKIYLFNYYGRDEKKGKIYELPVESILDELAQGQVSEGGANQRGYKKIHPWTDQGKTTIPDKDKDPFPTQQPAGDDSD